MLSPVYGFCTVGRSTLEADCLGHNREIPLTLYDIMVATLVYSVKLNVVGVSSMHR